MIKSTLLLAALAVSTSLAEVRSSADLNQDGIHENFRVNFSRSDSPRTMALEFLAKRQEVILRITVTSQKQIDELAEMMSVDNVDGFIVTAYANAGQFAQFEKLSLPYEVQIPESLTLPRDTIRQYNNYQNFNPLQDEITTFPSYTGYLDIMQSFVTAAPELCRLEEIGTSYDGRKILFLVISDNVKVDEAEPKVRVGSTIHGDETVGLIVYLKMAQNMIRSYKTDATITRMVDSVETWICPALNPDGTYRASQGAGQQGSIRFNAKGTDLNRSFPGPSQPSGASVSAAKEMTILSEFELKKRFTTGMDCHGGMEGIVMPWSYQKGIPAPSNKAVWQDLATKIIPGFQQIFVCENGPYAAAGTTFDFAYYAYGGILLCPEVTTTKMVQPGTFTQMYSKFGPGALKIIGESLNGVRGKITDASTGAGIEATVRLSKLDDAKYGAVKSYPDFGDYYHLGVTGTYSVTISPVDQKSYSDTVITGVNLKTGTGTILNVALRNKIVGISSAKQVAGSPFTVENSRGVLTVSVQSKEPLVASLYSVNGRKIGTVSLTQAGSGISSGSIPTTGLSSVFVVCVESGSQKHTQLVVNR